MPEGELEAPLELPLSLHHAARRPGLGRGSPALGGFDVVRHGLGVVVAVVLDRLLRDRTNRACCIEQACAQVHVLHAPADDGLVITVHASEVFAIEREIAAEDGVCTGPSAAPAIQCGCEYAIAEIVRLGVTPPERRTLDAPRAHVLEGQALGELG